MRFALALVMALLLAGEARAETRRDFSAVFTEAFGELAERIRHCATFRPNALIEVAMVGAARGNPHLDEPTRLLLNSLAAEAITGHPLFFATPGEAFAAAAPLVSDEEIARIFEILPNAPVLMAFHTRRPAPEVVQLRVIAYARQGGAVRCPDERVLFLDAATLREVPPVGGSRDHMTLEGALASLFGEVLSGEARDVLPYQLALDLPGDCEAREDLPFTVRLLLSQAAREGDVAGARRALRMVPESEGAADPETLEVRVRRPRGVDGLLLVEGEFLYHPARRVAVVGPRFLAGCEADLSDTGSEDQVSTPTPSRAFAPQEVPSGVAHRPPRPKPYGWVPPTEPLKRFREPLIGGGAGPEMVVLPTGTFWMGSPPDEDGRDRDEGPQHERRISSFALARTELTRGEWKACVDEGACRSDPIGQLLKAFGSGSDLHPVTGISWNDAQDYIRWLNEKVDGEPYRLPSEAEWEYAARTVQNGTVGEPAYFFGNHISSGHINYYASASYRQRVQFADVGTVPVDMLAAAENRWGLRHMNGNAWEWVEDCWHGDYTGAPHDGTAWLFDDGGDCSLRVLRGGSFQDFARYVRSAGRFAETPETLSESISFRVARDLD